MNLVLSRHGIWYSRFTYLLPCGRRKEIRRSLRTRCKRTARQKLQVVIQRCSHNKGEVVAQTVSEPEMCLKSAVEKWLLEREAEGLSLNERSRIKTYLNYLLVVVGNRKVSTIKRQQANQFKDSLVDSGRSPATINNYLKRAKMLYNWLSTRIDGLSNPFDGLAIRIRTAPSEQRQAYSSDDLRKLDVVVTDLPEHKQWIIQLARYTGMRQGEVCQLYADDIVRMGDGAWCVDVNDRRPDQKLKSANSARLIPLHSKLIERGLMDLVGRRQGGRLFPELKHSPSRGYGRYFQKWFGQWRIRVGLPEYHSLRHSVATTLKNEGVAEQYAASILGHAAGSITYNRYGKGVGVGKLTEVVELIN